MRASVNEIARQVEESSRVADAAVTQAEKTDAGVAELSQAASRIGEVVKLITAVARQTNLLALNVTIEAARAGEGGKGFTVVAHEVKVLASQTTKAAEDITAQISGMLAVTQDLVVAIKDIGATIRKISKSRHDRHTRRGAELGERGNRPQCHSGGRARRACFG